MAEMDMVERVAWAICDNAGSIWGGPKGEDDPDFLLPKLMYMSMARAAIEAMREPTEAMVDAVWTRPDANGSQYPIGGYREQYRAMIDAALNEQVAG
jgi:hypothetical protein